MSDSCLEEGSDTKQPVTVSRQAVTTDEKQSVKSVKTAPMWTHQRLDGVRYPEGHEAVLAVPVEVAGVVEKTKGGVRSDDSRGAKGMVEAT